ncbi:SDR family oxidoreductase [Flavobacterium sp. J27]|uniref:SDR family oxidoreductase n=1 Tax=Flavobacterium sp. J27 TaxID=2060419 RepID=UPI0010326F93|nr:SDR family oxidoreductase [Flavobacterium sp. J27]
MKVFVTGASGFIGSAVVTELIQAGHQVIGLARSESSAKKIKELGATPLLGNLEDLEILQQGAQHADAVIHTAFFHDFSQFTKAAAMDKAAINAMGTILMGTKKPMVVTAGILGLPLTNGYITEESTTENPLRFSELTALELAAKGVHASVIRLAPSVHDKGDKGFVPFIIEQARKKGCAAYPNEGLNRWTAVHRLDAAKAFRLAIEKGLQGALYNVIGENSITIKSIATQISTKLNLPLVALSNEETAKHFEWMSHFITFDAPATNLKTQEILNWQPKHIGLLEDMDQNYF